MERYLSFEQTEFPVVEDPLTKGVSSHSRIFHSQSFNLFLAIAQINWIMMNKGFIVEP